jgi:anti-sigma B factor antagonist
MALFHISDESQAVPQGSGEDIGVLAASGELDFGASPGLREAILRQLEAGRRSLVVDLSLVRFIDSTAIGVLMGAAARLRERDGGALVVACPAENERVMRIFDIAGVAGLVGLYQSREEAVLALAGPRSADFPWQGERGSADRRSDEPAHVPWPSVRGALRRYSQDVATGRASERTGGVRDRSRRRVDELA